MSATTALDGESNHMYSRDYASSLDAQDSLKHTREEFLVPTKAQLKAKSLPEAGKEFRVSGLRSFRAESESSS